MNDLANDSLRVLELNYPDSYYAARVSALINGDKPPKPDKSMFSTVYEWL